MRRAIGWSLAVLVACSGAAKSSDSGPGGTGPGSGGSGSGTSQGSTGAGSGSGSSQGPAGSDAGTGSGSASSGPDGGTLPAAGNPNGSCTTVTLPAEAQAVDTSHPTTVVGMGTAATCTFAALENAVNLGGIITFNCGPGVVTIPVTKTLTPPVSTGSTPLNIVIDGGNKISLDGGGAVRILSWLHDTWRTSKDTLTLQHIQLVNGKTTPTDKIPACPASGSISNTKCSQGYDDGEGGAIYMQDGSLRVIDSTFAKNQAALLGPDTGGGALYLYGTGSPSYIVGSTFQNNTASNAGAIGMLWAGAFIANSLFEGNSAVGTGNNNNDPTQCTCMNNGQNEIGSGGNGGAIYKDGGDGANLTICGDEIENNSSNEFGPAIFLTADGSNAQLIVDDSVLVNNVSHNEAGVWQWCTGVSTDNPHAAGSSTGSPAPTDTKFCTTPSSCSMTCSS